MRQKREGIAGDSRISFLPSSPLCYSQSVGDYSFCLGKMAAAADPHLLTDDWTRDKHLANLDQSHGNKLTWPHLRQGGRDKLLLVLFLSLSPLQTSFCVISQNWDKSTTGKGE